jgi:hypothetical protein
MNNLSTTSAATIEDIFGPIISSYSRAEAIEDGVLIDLTKFSFRPNLNVCQEVGIKFPIAMTSAAYSEAIQESGEPLPPCQDLSGRMFDVVYMLKRTINTGRQQGTVIRFPVSVINWRHRNGRRINATRRDELILKAVCGPGDNADPVITIMLTDED